MRYLLAPISLATLIIIGCGTMADAIYVGQARLAWADQPAGARSAFVRCSYEIAKHQCGASDHHTGTIKVTSCMNDQIQKYRSAEDKQAWLESHGCDKSRAKLQKDEI